MSEQTETAFGEQLRLLPWQRGVVAGLAGGLLMGVLMSIQMRPVIESAIPGLWTLSGGAVGWVVHMSNSAIFGVLFAAAVTRYVDRVQTVTQGVLAGGLYGAALWVVAAGVVMPVWLDLVGFANPPSIPNLAPMSLVAHLLYGVVLGGAYVALTEVEPEF